MVSADYILKSCTLAELETKVPSFPNGYPGFEGIIQLLTRPVLRYVISTPACDGVTSIPFPRDQWRLPGGQHLRSWIYDFISWLMAAFEAAPYPTWILFVWTIIVKPFSIFIIVFMLQNIQPMYINICCWIWYHQSLLFGLQPKEGSFRTYFCMKSGHLAIDS